MKENQLFRQSIYFMLCNSCNLPQLLNNQVPSAKFIQPLLCKTHITSVSPVPVTYAQWIVTSINKRQVTLLQTRLYTVILSPDIEHIALIVYNQQVALFS
ncbi:unnamed protein product [Paramecium sonneborni]|uniref:Uncharacterized protein n=1 Tax=Paramecium sonneborni TaxID=65129 RepID=A0A8S1NCG2_9CILI|nr:unnamed protein product [Paramecium sonneborni]